MIMGGFGRVGNKLGGEFILSFENIYLNILSCHIKLVSFKLSHIKKNLIIQKALQNDLMSSLFFNVFF